MKPDTENKRRLSTLWIILLTVVITVLSTLGGVYFMGWHPTHVAGTDVQDGQETTLWTCGMHPWIIEPEPGLCPICNMRLTPIRKDAAGDARGEDGKREIAYWRAPMNPMEIHDAPGKSAMGMDLVPVYEDEIIGGVAISIDPVTRQNMGIRTATVETGPLTRTIDTYGHVTYDETRTVRISPKISGWIEAIHADFEGKTVFRNEPLFEIYAPDLIAAQEEYLSAEKRASGDRFLVAAARKRLAYFDISEGDIRRLEKTGRIEKTVSIRSPINGVVLMKNVEQGSYVKAGTTIYRIADLSRVWVDVHIYEYELPWVKKGQTAKMTLPYEPGRTYTGQLSFIDPFLQPRTRDVVVRLEFDNPDFSIKPDMYGDIEIFTDLGKEGIIIPSEAVIRSGKRNVVFVTRENRKFIPREVTLGVALNQGNVQVLTGLAPGETVVTSGQFMLDSESKLKEAVQKMMEPKVPETERTEPEDGFFDDMRPGKDDFFSDMES